MTRCVSSWKRLSEVVDLSGLDGKNIKHIKCTVIAECTDDNIHTHTYKYAMNHMIVGYFDKFDESDW